MSPRCTRCDWNSSTRNNIRLFGCQFSLYVFFHFFLLLPRPHFCRWRELVWLEAASQAPDLDAGGSRDLDHVIPKYPRWIKLQLMLTLGRTPIFFLFLLNLFLIVLRTFWGVYDVTVCTLTVNSMNKLHFSSPSPVFQSLLRLFNYLYHSLRGSWSKRRSFHLEQISRGLHEILLCKKIVPRAGTSPQL